MTGVHGGIRAKLSRNSDILIAIVAGLAIVSVIVIYLLNIPYSPPAAEKAAPALQPARTDNDSLVLDNGTRLIRVIENNTYSVDIEYTSDGRQYRYIFFPELVPALEWLKNNTRPDDTVTSWWDYGHTIRGYSDRKALAYAPSKSILFSVADYAVTVKWDAQAAGELEEDRKIYDIASILSSSDYSRSRELMKKHNSKYILISSSDVSKTWIMYNVTSTSYEIVNTSMGPIAVNSTSLIFQILNLSKIDGFELAFTDNRNAAIYRVV